MKKHFIVVAIMAGMALLFMSDASAQSNSGRRMNVRANKNYATRELPGMADFRTIRSEGIADVEYRQSNDVRVSIYGSENLLQYVEVENINGVLKIRISKNVNIQGEYKLKVIASSPELIMAHTTGSGDIDILSNIEAKKIELSTSSTGDISFRDVKTEILVLYAKGTGDIEGDRVECDNALMTVTGTGDIDIDYIYAKQKIEISLSGRGDVEVNGQTEDIVMKLRGAGDIDAYRLKATNVDVTVAGTGDISCYAEKSLKASVSGFGSVVYGGNPKEVDIRGNNRRVSRR